MNEALITTVITKNKDEVEFEFRLIDEVTFEIRLDGETICSGDWENLNKLFKRAIDLWGSVDA